MAKRFQRPQTPRYFLSVKKKFPESSLMFGNVRQGASVSGRVRGEYRPQCTTILAIATPKEEAHHCWKLRALYVLNSPCISPLSPLHNIWNTDKKTVYGPGQARLP